MAPRNVEDIYPLSPMQRLMLLHSLAAPTPDVLVNRICYEVEGGLDRAAFRAAWEALTARHPALRTCILWEGLDRPVQVVRRDVELPFHFLDPGAGTGDALEAVGFASRAEALDAIDARAGPLDLRRAPLMECSLAPLRDGRHLFAWRVHHLVADRWSLETVLAELGPLYAASRAGSTPSLPPATGVREYMAWLERQDPADAARYWQRELADLEAPTLLTDGPTPTTGAGRERAQRTLPSDLVERLRARAAVWRSSPASVLLSAIGLAVAARTGRSDVVCGLTVSGRPPDLRDIEATVGSFVNNVPYRWRLDPERSLAEEMRALQRRTAERYPFEHVSLAEIADWAGVPTSKPLFDLLVLVNVSHQQAPRLPGLRLRPISATLDAAYPLLLSLEAAGAELTLDLVHSGWTDADVFLAEIRSSIARLVNADPAATLGEVLPELASAAGGPPARGDTAGEDGRGPARPSAAGARAKDDAELDAEALRRIWSDALGREEVRLDDDFFELGGTSLQAARLFLEIERISGRALSLSTLLRARTIRTLLEALGRPVQPEGPVIEFRASGSRDPLFVVPGIGGNVVSLMALAEALGPEQPFFGLQSRGLVGEDRPLTSIDRIAEDFVDQMLPAAGEAFHLLGLCWGAAVAYEMAGQLVERGHAPRSLALLDPAILLGEEGDEPERTELRFVRKRLALYRDELAARDWPGRTRFVTDKLQRAARFVRARGVPEESRMELDHFRVREANRVAVSRYRPRPLEARARLFLTRDRELADADEDPRLVWRELIRPVPDVVLVPGLDSGNAIDRGNVDEFAGPLKAWLAESSAPT